MIKKNNEILSILLASFALFIFLSIVGFSTSYEPAIIYQLFNESNYTGSLPITGILGASISAILVKYF